MKTTSQLIFVTPIITISIVCASSQAQGASMVTPTPKEEAQQLVDALFPIAEKLLTSHGEFYPFGAVILSDGTIKHIAAYNGQEHPLSNTLINLLHDSFSAQAKSGKIKCSAILYDVKVIPPGKTEKSDAVAIELEHKSGYNVTVIFPYTLSGSTLNVSPAYAIKGSNHVFP